MAGIESFPKTIELIRNATGSFSLPAGGQVTVHTVNDFLSSRLQSIEANALYQHALRLSPRGITLAQYAKIFGLTAIPYQLLADAITEGGFLTPEMWVRWKHGDAYIWDPTSSWNYGFWPHSKRDEPADGWASPTHPISSWGHPYATARYSQQAVAQWNADRHVFHASGGYAVWDGYDPHPGFANPARWNQRYYTKVGGGPNVAPQRVASMLVASTPAPRALPKGFESQADRIRARHNWINEHPQTATGFGANGRRRRLRPRGRRRWPRWHEGKSGVDHATYQFAKLVLGQVGEYEDFIDSIYNSLPEGVKASRTQYYGNLRRYYVFRADQLTLQRKVGIILDNYQLIDMPDALWNLFYNALEDGVFGFAGRKLAKAAREAGSLSPRLFGFQTGPAL